jgi:Bifunctional DNA primase/polymerase, N-terminal
MHFAGDPQQNLVNDRSRRESRHTYHFAAQYLERGWSVIPLLPESKVAAIAWKPYQSRLPTWKEIGEWFKNDRLNIGIVAGRVSQLIVADCDTRADSSWWRAHYPDSSLVVNSGRGQHIYYRLEADDFQRNRSKVFGRAIDIRCASYLVAPPSIHPSGHIYSWEKSGDYDLEAIPVFDSAWVASQSGNVDKEDCSANETCVAASGPRSKRTTRRIQGLVRHLDKDVPDRSARDWGVVMGLLRLGCSAEEVAALVGEHSKFRGDEKYLALTIENAAKHFSGRGAVGS